MQNYELCEFVSFYIGYLCPAARQIRQIKNTDSNSNFMLMRSQMDLRYDFGSKLDNKIIRDTNCKFDLEGFRNMV